MSRTTHADHTRVTFCGCGCGGVRITLFDAAHQPIACADFAQHVALQVADSFIDAAECAREAETRVGEHRGLHS